MGGFVMNNRYWRIIFVEPDSPYLVDRTGSSCLATTDPSTNHVYISSTMQHTPDMLRTVILHELGHVVMVSYDMLGHIRRMIRPEYWVEVEEWICNFVADYGYEIFQTANYILGDDNWTIVPKAFRETA